jgi:hypothetical protein
LQSETKDLPSDYHTALTCLQQAGFTVVTSCEAFTDTVFSDVGAIVYFLKAVPWQVPDFSIDKCYDQLRAIHDRIQTTGQVIATRHRFYIEAQKP